MSCFYCYYKSARADPGAILHKGIVKLAFIALAAAGWLSPATETAAQSGRSHFRFGIGGGATYTEAFSGVSSASPQFRIGSRFWIGPYANYNYEDYTEQTDKRGPYRSTTVINEVSGTERQVDSSRVTQTDSERLYGAGLSLSIALGKRKLSELEARLGVEQEEVEEHVTTGKTITYLRDGEVLEENRISHGEDDFKSEYIPRLSLAYKQYFGDSKTFSIELGGGYKGGVKEGFFGQGGINIQLGG